MSATRLDLPRFDRGRSGGSASFHNRRALEHALFGFAPILITALLVYTIYADGNSAVDFQHSFWQAGWRTLHGTDPYSWTRAQIAGGVSFPYPAPVALLLAPLALISSPAAGIPVTAACIIAAPLALWIVEINDWRLYGAVALWAPVVVGWQTANFTLPLIVGTALLWRWRRRRWPAAVLVACLVSVKPIMAPLWVWLVLTRRWRTAALGVGIGTVLNAVSWTVLGWHHLGGWLKLLSLQGSLRDGTGYSLIAVTRHLGLAQPIGTMLMVGCGCALAWIAVLATRAGQPRRVFAAAVLLTIVIAPEIDSHYFALLLLPLALERPRLSWPWLLPLVLWVCPATQARLWQEALWWTVVGVIAGVILRSRAPQTNQDPILATAG